VEPPLFDPDVSGREPETVPATPLKSPPAATPAIKRRGGFVNSWRS
jgi:hypothetical protein